MSEIEQTLWVQIYVQNLTETGDKRLAERAAEDAVRSFRVSNLYFLED